MNQQDHERLGGSETPEKPEAERMRKIPSKELLQGAREVFIEHGDDIYRLRLTRNGKLILHK